MYKQVGKQRALVTLLGILMKNSNNIKWGVSTADTLLLRALQTDGVTRYTHYAATVQPLSVMMMAAFTGAQLLIPVSCKHPPPLRREGAWGGGGGGGGGGGLRFLGLEKKERRGCVKDPPCSGMSLIYLPGRKTSRVTWIPCDPHILCALLFQ